MKFRTRLASLNPVTLHGSRAVRTIVLLGVTCALVLALGAGSALAAVGSSYDPDPLPGSSFAGADGNQLTAPDAGATVTPQTDWQNFANDPGLVQRVDQPLDGQGTRDYFFKGHESTPTDWQRDSVSGAITPAKSNALAAWSITDPLTADVFLYFSFVRESDANSNAFYGLELFQDGHMWENGQTNPSPPASDGQPTQIPCRSNGDLMISYEVDPSNKNVQIVFYEWTNGAGPTDTDPLHNCPEGATGAWVLANPQPGSGQAYMNFDGPIDNFLRTDLFDDTLATGRFGEASINIDKALNTDLSGRPCFNFGYGMMHSRSSSSLSSAMQDTIDPFPIQVANCTINVEKTVRVRDGNTPSDPASDTYDDSATGSVGSTFDYKFDVSVPTGSQSLAISDFSDTFPGSRACDPVSVDDQDGFNVGDADQNDLVDPGEHWIFTCSYKSGSGDVAASPIENTATVEGRVSGCEGELSDCGDSASDTAEITVTPLDTSVVTTASDGDLQTDGSAVISDSATLSGGTADAGGKLTFRVYSDADCTTLAADPVEVDVSGADGDSYPSGDVTVHDGAGDYYWSVAYTGDDNNNGFAETDCGLLTGGNDEVSHVDKLGPTVTTTATPTVQIGAHDTANISDSATLSGGTSNAGGTLTFHVYSDSSCETEVGSATANVDGADGDSYGSGNISVSQAGTYYWSVEYTGDANNGKIDETACGLITGGNSERSVVTPRTPSPVTTATASVQIGSDDSAKISDSATLSGGTDGAGGTLTFRVYSDSDCETLVGSKTVSVEGANGDTYNSGDVTVHAAGTYYWSVSYSGDGVNNNGFSETACGLITGGNSERSVVTPRTPTVTTDAVTDVQLTDGAATLHDTATLSGGTAGASGTLTFHLYSDASCQNEVAGSPVTADVDGADGDSYQSPDITVHAAGTYYWSVSYSGDGVNNAGFDETQCGLVGDGNQERSVVPDLHITKTADDSLVEAGDQIGFTITVSGSGPAKDVVLSDPLPAGPAGHELNWSIESVDGIAGDKCSISGDPGSQTLHCDAVDLGGDPDGTASQSYSVHVVSATDANSPGFRATNTATASASNHDDVEASDSVRVIQTGLLVVKTGAPGTVHDGDTITFHYAVSNPGTDPVTVDSISDDKCSPVTGPTSKTGGNDDNLLDPGETWTYECTTSAKHSDENASREIVNTVTVRGHDEREKPLEATDDHTTKVIHPAIAIDKSGPNTGEAGQKIGYVLSVTNPGDTSFAESTVNVTDAQCNGDPVALIGKGGDPTPGSLDPGDVWTYSCSVQTQVGDQAVHNEATVEGTDQLGKTVTATDSADTALTQPEQLVLPERIVPGTARLLGPTGCVARAFNARVRGTKIAKVVFFLDGKKKKTLTRPNKKGLYQLRINPKRLKVGVHRLVANVTFQSGSGTKPRTLRLSFQRCAKKLAAPRFTG